MGRSVTTIKLRHRQLGEHVHVDVFMGKRVGALALTGTLVMDVDEMRALALALEYGAGNAKDRRRLGGSRNYGRSLAGHQARMRQAR
jgi:hypothetical protein